VYIDARENWSRTSSSTLLGRPFMTPTTPFLRLLKLSAIIPLLFVAQTAFAVTFTNTTLQTTPHPKPILSTEEGARANSVPLEEAKTLNVFRNTIHGISLWRFELDEAYWWVTPKGVIWGKGTQEVSSSTSALLEAGNDEEAYQVYLVMP
jgi:hypothetical protein